MPRRVGLTPMMALIAVLALGLAALRSASPMAVFATSMMTLAALFFVLLALVVRPSPGPSIKGFVLFGWGYLWLGLLSPTGDESFLSSKGLALSWFADTALDSLHPSPPIPVRPFPSRPNSPGNFDGVRAWGNKHGLPPTPLTVAEAQTWDAYEAALTARQAGRQQRGDLERNSRQICQALLTLLFGLLGAIAGPPVAGRDRRARSVSGGTS